MNPIARVCVLLLVLALGGCAAESAPSSMFDGSAGDAGGDAGSDGGAASDAGAGFDASGASDAGFPDADASGPAGSPFDAEPPFRYFHNRIADGRVATGGVVPVSDLVATLVGYLDRTEATVDLAVFQFSDPAIADALVRAHQRGVRVRLVLDADNLDEAAANLATLAAEGIAHLDDAANGQPSSALMHDKFLVLDGTLVFTGSYNLTPNGATLDRQDVLVVHDDAFAARYTAEFEQMWGTNLAAPDPLLARFHNRKADLGDHSFVVGGRAVEVWFAPVDDDAGGGPMAHLMGVVATADVSIDFHIFAFSEQLLADAMQTRAELGVHVRGVFDSTYWNATYSESLDLRGLTMNPSGGLDPDPSPWSPPAEVYSLNELQFLHAKTLVVDAASPASSPTVALGSFNWSASANDANDENLVIVRDDAALANQFLQAICGSVLAAGGSCLP